MQDQKISVSVYGLGYVGLTLSIVLAEEGFKVYGIDNDRNKIKLLNKNKSFLHENNIEDRLNFISKHRDIKYIDKSDNIPSNFHIIAVGTPINKNKLPIVKSIENVLRSIVKNLKKNDCIILRSTVPVGFTKNFIIKKISKITKLKPGIDYNICFAPERTIEGKALEELKTNPQIIGGFSEKCLSKGINFFRNITDKIIKVKNLETAEIAKLIDNSYRDTVFAYSNEISMICDKYSINTNEVISACNSDYHRNNIPFPSPGVGGACLSKDPHILIHSAKQKNYNARVIKSSRQTNELSVKQIGNKILKKINKIKKPKILICGLAFKGVPENSDYRNSTTIDLIDYLNQKNKKINIFVYDPVISKKEILKLNYSFFDLHSNSKKFNSIIFANNHPSFSNYKVEDLFKKLSFPYSICDCWNVLQNTNIKSHKEIDYYGVGF